MRFKNLGWPIPSSFTMDMGSWIVHVPKVPLLGMVSTKRSISTDNDILRGLGTSHPEIKGNFKDQRLNIDGTQNSMDPNGLLEIGP